jgi:hypothetical protein
MREFFHCLRAALREVFRPEPFIDPDPQSTDEATAVRNAYIRANRPDRR